MRRWIIIISGVVLGLLFSSTFPARGQIELGGGSFLGGTLTAQLVLINGTEAAPAVVFTNATTAGLIRQGTGFGLVANGEQQVLVSDGSVTFQNGAVVIAPDGTSGAPSVTFTSEQDVGIYRHGNNTLGISAGGGGRLTISNTLIEATVKFLPDTLTQATLGTATAGHTVFCSDCTVGSAPCTGSGAGTLAVANGAAWNCL